MGGSRVDYTGGDGGMEGGVNGRNILDCPVGLGGSLNPGLVLESDAVMGLVTAPSVVVELAGSGMKALRVMMRAEAHSRCM